MHDRLLHRLHSLVLLNPAQDRALCQVLQTETFPKDYPILEAGQIANHIYFVVSGGIRAFKQVDEKEVTTWFSFPDHFAVPYFSFAHRQPSEDGLVTLSNSQLTSISYENLRQLCSQDQVWVDVNRHLLERHYTALQNRVTSFQVQSAQERHASIVQEHPDIEEKVNLGHLASYLGISQETLSRLRSRCKKRSGKLI
jgi:CRP/FNR family transcriptional regulator, anaerobic regulatory protein